MTSKNVKKFLRTDVKLKQPSWPLAKNTFNMVNCGIEKLCVDSKNILNSVNTRPENKGPLRALKSYQHERIPLSINVPGARRHDMASLTECPNTGGVHHERSLEKSVIGQNSAVASLIAQRKIMKSTPNYKIYSSRRFGSSASSSRASLFRRYDNRHRTSQRKPHLSCLQRSLKIYKGSRTSNNYMLNGSVATYENLVQARNQHIMIRQADDVPPDVVKMSAALRHELMPVNREVKDQNGQAHLKLSFNNLKCNDPLNGWWQPPNSNLLLTCYKERGIPNAQMQEHYRKMRTTRKIHQFEQLEMMERRSNIMGFVRTKSTHHRIGAGAGGTKYNNGAKLITPLNLPQQKLRAAAEAATLSTDEMKTGYLNITTPIGATAGVTMVKKKAGDLCSTKRIKKLNKKKTGNANSGTPINRKAAITTTKSKFLPPQSQKDYKMDRAPTIYTNTATLNGESAVAQSIEYDKKMGEIISPAPFNKTATIANIKPVQSENVEEIVRAPTNCKKSPTARLLNGGGAATQSMAHGHKIDWINTHATIVKAATIITKKSYYTPPQTEKVEQIVPAPKICKTSPTAVLIKGQSVTNNIRYNRSAYYIKHHWATKKI